MHGWQGDPISVMRTAAPRFLSTYLQAPVERLLTRLGLSPNVITLLGLLVAGAGAYLLSIGLLAAGGAVILLAGLFDLFDGAVARATNRVTPFGALLDSVVDRVSEAVVLLGLLVLYIDRSFTAEAILVYVALVGSIMVSYVRARAEGLHVECKEVGIMTRPERIAVLGVGLIIGQWWVQAVWAVLAIIAVLTSVTTAQRILHVWRVLAERESAVPRVPDPR